MVSQASAAPGLGLLACDWLCKPAPDADARSDGSARTMDEAVDLEVLALMAASEHSHSAAYDVYEDDEDDDDDCCGERRPSVSGLPLVCSNCGVSFFSLQIPDDQVDCYCSGECKWSVIMYREMDLRMLAMRRPARRHATPLSSTCSSSSICDDDERERESLVSLSFSDDSTASLSCS
ncbi:hypothetical protein PHYSODRAFT_353457 [Phytophthora sojae]|uniref:FLZ-type domain-containing protein n=1 Tax=Phytophthora sojae (strain P6497) TaxID=1094619 RepID=G4YPG5_PHYSP|nr:hypothetical protein PHYSODRAFT_353457 [Phytophthora sojae]EGZ27945.1 hypothetical protein PHYSODRAFT_353457 [Phytophthora sojae]|eukprot:XP_009515220.1 hypothetical protein PHYSODRAFT_353457 [Phytophthora sojae]